MGYLIAAILLTINLALIIFNKKSKHVALITMLLMWLLFWANYSNPDYYNYELMYNSTERSISIFSGINTEIGYLLIIKLFIFLGFDYVSFLAIVSLLCFLLIHSTVRKFTQNYNLVYIAYFIFPFFLDIVQLRNFIAMSIFIYSIKFLFESTRLSRFKFASLIIMAGTIHYSAFFYLPMLFINLKKQNRTFKVIMYISVIMSIFILLNNKNIPYLDVVARVFFQDEKRFSWTISRTNWGFLVSWFFQFMSFFLVQNIRKRMNSETNKGSYIVQKQLKFIDLVYMINIVAFIYLPFYLLASTFGRLMRNILILNYTAISIYGSVEKNSNSRIKFYGVCFLYILILSLQQLYFPYFDIVVQQILEKNLFY